MKNALILLALLPLFSFGQPNIEYGSNNGKYLDVYGSGLYHETYGAGVPLLLLHGGMGSISNFTSVIPELSKHYKIYALDSPGHGRSEGIDSLSYQTMSNHISEFIRKLELDSLHIAGFSDGAIAALWVARDHPEKVKKVIFGAGALGPGYSTPDGLAMLRSILPETIPETFANAYREKSPNPEEWEGFVNASKQMWLDPVWFPEEELEAIKAKTLILFGDRDPFIPLQHTLDIYSRMSDGSLSILPDTGHGIFENAELVLPVLMDFLEGS